MDVAKRGARVVIASRNLEKSNKVKDEIIKESGNHEVYDVCYFHDGVENKF